MRVYRLIKPRYATSALDGTGARLHGGRWSPKGLGLLYTSDTPSLAALELLVHLHRSEALEPYLLFSLEVEDATLMTLDAGALPPGWRNSLAPKSTATIGAQWVASGQSPALAVPSVLIPQQSNVLIAPNHPGFADIAASARSEPFDFDPRLAA